MTSMEEIITSHPRRIKSWCDGSEVRSSTGSSAVTAYINIFNPIPVATRISVKEPITQGHRSVYTSNSVIIKPSHFSTFNHGIPLNLLLSYKMNLAAAFPRWRYAHFQKRKTRTCLWIWNWINSYFGRDDKADDISVLFCLRARRKISVL